MMVLGMPGYNPRKLLAVVLCVGAAWYANCAFGEDARRTFELEAFDERRSQAPAVGVTPKQITEQQRRLRKTKAAQNATVFGQALRSDEQQWKAEAGMMRREMEMVLRLARQDGEIRAWASALDFLGSLAIGYAEFRAQQDADGNSGGETAGAPDTPPQGFAADLDDPKKPHYRIRQEGRQSIEWCLGEGNDCKLIEYNEVIRSLVVPDTSKATPGRDLNEDFFREGTDVLGALPGSLRCLELEQRCYTVSDRVGPQTAGTWQDDDKGLFARTEGRVPDDGFGQFGLNLRETNASDEDVGKKVFSFLADVLPGVGTLKGGIEAFSGRDPITGEEVNRIAVSVGFVASVVPGGKLYVKGAVGGGKIVVRYAKKKLRHYTSRQGSERILKEGVIRPGKYGRIHAESGNRRLLSPSDATERYGLRTGRGRDVVEFSPEKGQRWYTIKNPNTGVDEVVVEGNVRLGPGSTVLQRD